MYSCTTPSIDAFITGPRYKRKKAATSASRIAAIESMTATSLVNTDWRPARSFIRASDKPVARSSNRLDKRRFSGIVTEFLPHSADEDIDGSIVGVQIDPVCFVQYAIATEDTSPIPHEQTEQLEFRRREREQSPIQPRRGRRPVDLQWTRADAILLTRFGAPSQHRLHASH